MSQDTLLYDFTSDSKSDWTVVNDGVMGGLSEGHIMISDEGHGVFKGEVSLENNGGFTSIRHNLDIDLNEDRNAIVIRLKGDGKRYQFRIKQDREDYYSYIQYFQTSGEWEEIELPLDEFYPSFRGSKLDMRNFNGERIEEISFMIANKKAQEFRLEIDWIKLK